MGTDTPKESSGPIRRFPNGFWTVFNQWWHGEFTRQGQRPSSKAIGKWHAENALKVWGENAVSYAETQRHANRMKCRRTVGHLLRQAAVSAEDDDDEDETYCQDTPMPNAADGGVQPPTAMEKPGAEGSSTMPVERGSTANARINFGAHSDPPGALRSYMNADSDLPAPAASCRDAAPVHLSAANPSTQASWMQPDPVGLVGHSSGMGPASEIGFSSLSWNSSFSLPRRPGDAASDSPAILLDSALSLAAAGNARGAKRGRDAAPGLAGPPADADKGRPLQYNYPRANPFAEVAAAAAAAAGFSVTSAMPAARDAALLINSAAVGGALSVQLNDPRTAPAWLQRAGQELDSLMQELGITQGDGGRLAQPALMRKSRVLSSVEPLRLPEVTRKRDLDSLLRRGLPRAAPAESAGIPPLSRKPTAGRGMSCQGAPEQVGQARACAQQAGSDGMGPAQTLLGRPSWAAGPASCGAAAGSAAGGAGLLTSIDCMPLEALL